MTFKLSPRLVDIGSIILVKFSTLGLTAYALIFLTAFGGLTSVGHYSAVTAVTAPIGMFCTFRHVEWISLAENKNQAFSTAIVCAISSFCITIPFLIALLAHQIQDYIFVVTLILYKPLELASGYVSTLFLCKNDRQTALISSALKILLVITITTIGVLFKIENIKMLVAGSLLIGFLTVLFTYDLKHLYSYKLKLPFLTDLKTYVKENFSLGILNLMVSFNSSLPRYYLIYNKEMATLGLFSLTYQVAATLTNLIQHVISIKIVKISKLMAGHRRILTFLLSNLGMALIISTILLYEEYFYFPIPFLPTLGAFLSTSGVVFLMFLFLTLRGLLISLNIANSASKQLFAVVISSSAVSITLLAFLQVFLTSPSALSESFIFVLLSSYVSSLILRRTAIPHT